MLSIIVPIFNAEEYLKKCIDSVINQSYKDFELLLIDDGSDDGSLPICKQYENADCRIRVIAGKHKGPYYARKSGVESARGDYITFVDADDFVSREAYIMAKDDMKKSIDIISFNIFRYFDESNIRFDECSLADGIYNRREIEKKFFPVMIWDNNRNSFGIDPSLWSKLYKASLLKDFYCTAQNVNFHYGEDVAVIYPLIGRSESLSIHHEAYYYHRQRLKGSLPAYIRDRLYFDKLYELYKSLSEKMSFNELFQRQIDLFYIHSVEFAKQKYGITLNPAGNIFPFDRVEKGERIVLYGAGNIGKLYVKQLKMLDYCNLILWVDKNYERLEGGIGAPEEILKTDYDKIIIAIANQNVRNQAAKYLVELGISRECII